jgi:cytochrome b
MGADCATEAGRTPRPAEAMVWDPVVRIFHWSVAMLFAIAWISEDWQFVHQPAGYMILALVGLRVVWGIVGTRHAKFSDFICRPVAIIEHIRSLLSGSPSRSLGHNPLGGLMVVALLAMLLATGASGWLMTTNAMRGTEWFEELHEALASTTLVLVGLHVLGVVVMSVLHGENLLWAMITGRKKPRDFE